MVLCFQILYTGRAQCLGIKQSSVSNNPLSASDLGRFNELTIPKSAKITDFSVGHEGHHALLLAEDGCVYFVGTARKGEDGDNSSCEFTVRIVLKFNICDIP